MKLVRFTLRLAMILLAAVAVLLGAGADWMRKRSKLLSLASMHAAEACDGRIAPLAQRAGMSESELSAYYERRLVWEEHHAGLARKYAQAARFPWLPLSPDPPEPQ